MLRTRSRMDSPTTALGNSGYQSDGRPVGGQDQRPSRAADPLGQQLIQVVGLGGGELPHREVVADQHGGLGELADAGLEAAVGVPAGQVGQQPGAGGEGDVVAAAAGLVAQRGGQVALARPRRARRQGSPRRRR